MKTTSATRCSVQLKGHNFCDAHSIEDAPFPICERHMIQVIRFAMDGPTRREAAQDRKSAETYRANRAKRDAASVVYYLDMGDGKIKIGRSARILGRLETLYRTQDDVLAVEIGGHKTEAFRHKEFSAERIGKTENFHASDRLKSHVHSLATAKNALTLSAAIRQQRGNTAATEPMSSPLMNWF